MSYIILRGRWPHVIVLNVQAPKEDEINHVNDSFYMQLERICNKFSKYDMKILLGDFNAKVSREDVYNRQLGMKVYTKIVIIIYLRLLFCLWFCMDVKLGPWH
jgi:exonuclease III